MCTVLTVLYCTAVVTRILAKLNDPTVLFCLTWLFAGDTPVKKEGECSQGALFTNQHMMPGKPCPGLASSSGSPKDSPAAPQAPETPQVSEVHRVSYDPRLAGGLQSVRAPGPLQASSCPGPLQTSPCPPLVPARSKPPPFPARSRPPPVRPVPDLPLSRPALGLIQARLLPVLQPRLLPVTHFLLLGCLSHGQSALPLGTCPVAISNGSRT